MRNSELEIRNDEAENAVGEEIEVISESAGDEEPTETPSPAINNKAHLSSSVPRAARVPNGALTKGEMAEIREIFGDMDDAEIQRLYKRVTK